MMEVIVPDVEYWNDDTQEFITIKGGKFIIEHSLVSISKWEAKWKKPFLSDKEKTEDEFIDYVKQMTITQNVDPNIYDKIRQSRTCMEQIYKYIEDPHTATTFAKGPDSDENKKAGSQRKEIWTSELIYYYMFTAGISKECEKWHINRLLTLLRVFSVKNKEAEKGNKKTKGKPNLSQRAALNAERKARNKTSG